MTASLTESRPTADPAHPAADPAHPATSRPRAGAFGHATGLSCRECGHRCELGPYYACPECFGPLEVAYDFPAITREEIEAGPHNIWRYQALLPVPVRHRAEPEHWSPASPGC